ncbi:MAG TPA: hypothetical protein VET48_05220, partial [Steroidobacteraceae bacterium]|nr:hypothetical protein [Steroidobacteraceae bacterium]
PQLPDEDAIWEMQLACQARLAALGYAQYEVSAYALSGFMCCHNLNYWHFGDYLGLGAGAHGKWTDAITQTIHRSVRVKQPRTYLAGQTAAARLESSQTISPSELPFEFMLNALRLCEGFSAEQFESRTGHTLASLGSTLSRACRLGLVEECDQSCWRATPFGRRFLNDLQSMFLVEIPSSTTALSAPSTAV